MTLRGLVERWALALTLVLVGCDPEVIPVDATPDDDAGIADAGPDATGPDAPGNRGPIAIDDAPVVRAEIATELDVLANDSDPDGDPLTIIAVGSPSHGLASFTGARVTYQPEAGYVGGEVFTYTIADSAGETATATIRLTIRSDANLAPTAVADDAETSVETAVVISVLDNDSDPESDALHVEMATDPANGSVTHDGTAITYVPDAAFTGADTFDYEVQDAAGAAASATVTVMVFALPDAIDDTASTAVDLEVRIAVLDNDVHPSGLAFSLDVVSAAAHGAVSIDGDDAAYLPGAGFAGTDSFTYTVRDSRGMTDTATVTLYVTGGMRAGELVASHDQTLTIRADGSLLAWGQISGAFFTSTATPTPVGTATNWSTIATGAYHSCAIDDTGALFCWGDGNDGKLGLGDFAMRALPTRVGTEGGWTAISLGKYHTCGIREGALYCWGEGNAGKLGLGVIASRNVPTQVGVLTTWTSVSAGDEHTCGIADGELWCWGYNGQVQLGDASLGAQSTTPARIGSASDWQSLATAGLHSCGLRRDGSLWCWGRMPPGADLTVPTRMGTSNGWIDVAVGAESTCGIDAGALYCWGRNATGRLGDGTQTDRVSPTRVGLGVDWTRVAVGRNHACGMRAGGLVSCWGSRALGQVGDGVTLRSNTPVRVGVRSDWTSVMSGGASYACATTSDGALWCWGSPGESPTPSVVPTQIGTSTGWSILPEGGPSHLCAMRSDGGLWCWGSGTYGRLGLGSSASFTLPQPVGGTTMFIDAAAGDGHTCAVTSLGAMQCWGLNSARQIGINTGASYPAPVVVGTETNYVSVAAGLQHTCAVRSDGTMWCWGGGSGTTPTQFGAETDWREVSAARLRNCAIRNSGALYCWTQGGSDYARVGLDADWANVSVSSAGHTCGTRTGGTLWCFGTNAAGQLGDGTISSRTLPVRVGTESDWIDVAAGGAVSEGHTCGIRMDGSLWCWGAGEGGQLGQGNAIATTPVMLPGS